MYYIYINNIGDTTMYLWDLVQDIIQHKWLELFYGLKDIEVEELERKKREEDEEEMIKRYGFRYYLDQTYLDEDMPRIDSYLIYLEDGNVPGIKNFLVYLDKKKRVVEKKDDLP